MQKAFIILHLLFINSVLAGVYEPHTIWDKTEISVCFYDSPKSLIGSNYSMNKKTIKAHGFKPTPFTKSERDFLKNYINAQYTSEETGIFFTGWMRCSKQKERDVIIIKGRANIGNFGVIKNGGYFPHGSKTPSIAFTSKGLKDYYTLTHEFGHIAGLGHEHIMAKDRNECFYKDKEKTYNTFVQHTEYDPNSIMNYCRTYLQRQELPSAGLLSEQDKETLLHLYN